MLKEKDEIYEKLWYSAMTCMSMSPSSSRAISSKLVLSFSGGASSLV